MIKVTIPEDGQRGTFVLWMNNIATINYFLATPLEEDGVNSGRERKAKSIKAHTRRRGPSDDSPSNVTAAMADYMYDPTLKSGNALPGRSIVLQIDTSVGDNVTPQKRQMTLVGRALDFQEWGDDKFKEQTFCFFSEGGRHTFKKPANSVE
jgi:hypothetical protein